MRVVFAAAFVSSRAARWASRAGAARRQRTLDARRAVLTLIAGLDGFLIGLPPSPSGGEESSSTL
jgi:hypothetical protein